MRTAEKILADTNDLIARIDSCIEQADELAEQIKSKVPGSPKYGQCPKCGFEGELHGDQHIDSAKNGDVFYRERWICAREDEALGGYLEGLGCKRHWWEIFKHDGKKLI